MDFMKIIRVSRPVGIRGKKEKEHFVLKRTGRQVKELRRQADIKSPDWQFKVLRDWYIDIEPGTVYAYNISEREVVFFPIRDKAALQRLLEERKSRYIAKRRVALRRVQPKTPEQLAKGRRKKQEAPEPEFDPEAKLFEIFNQEFGDDQIGSTDLQGS